MYFEEIFFISLLTLSLSYCKVNNQPNLTSSSHINESIQFSDNSLDTRTRSVNCFDVYMEKMNKISEKFQQDTQTCINIAEEAHNEAEKQTLGKQNDLKEKTEESCNTILNCENIDSAIEGLKCYDSKSAINAPVFRGISSDASNHLTDLKSEFRSIDRKQQQCVSKARRDFDEATDDAMDELSDCIKGNSQFPMPAPSSAVSLNHYRVL